MWICLDIMCGVSSVVNLVLISVDRCVRIILGLHYQRIFTPSRVKTMIMLSWLYAAVLASVKGIFFDWEKPNYEVLVFTMGFGLPLLIITICHCKIFQAARRQAKKVRENTIRAVIEQKKEFKAIKMIVTVIFAFTICWCPFFLLNLTFGLCPSCIIPAYMITISKLLHYSNSVLNPIIYACMNKEFRSAFYALMTRSAFKVKRRHSSFSNKRSTSQGNDIASSVVSMLSVSQHQNRWSKRSSCRSTCVETRV